MSVYRLGDGRAECIWLALRTKPAAIVDQYNRVDRSFHHYFATAFISGLSQFYRWRHAVGLQPRGPVKSFG